MNYIMWTIFILLSLILIWNGWSLNFKVGNTDFIYEQYSIKRFFNKKEEQKVDRELISDMSGNPDILFLEQEHYDKAFVGTSDTGNGAKAVYDIDKLIEVMVEQDGMTYEEAMEYYDFNINSAYMGEFTPIYITAWKG